LFFENAFVFHVVFELLFAKGQSVNKVVVIDVRGADLAVTLEVKEHKGAVGEEVVLVDKLLKKELKERPLI
jgi:hypothetical protein